MGSISYSTTPLLFSAVLVIIMWPSKPESRSYSYMSFFSSPAMSQLFKFITHTCLCLTHLPCEYLFIQAPVTVKIYNAPKWIIHIIFVLIMLLFLISILVNVTLIFLFPIVKFFLLYFLLTFPLYLIVQKFINSMMLVSLPLLPLYFHCHNSVPKYKWNYIYVHLYYCSCLISISFSSAWQSFIFEVWLLFLEHWS